MSNSAQTIAALEIEPLSPKKEAILLAAARLFSQKGYAAISMRVLAKEIGITPAALYHHYSDKEALYYAVLQYVFSDKAVAIEDLLKGGDAPENRLELLIVWFTELFSKDAVFTRLLHRELLDGDEGRIRLLTQEVLEAPFQEIEKLMVELAPEENARQAAISIIALILGYFELMPILQNLTGCKTGNDDILSFASDVKKLVLFGLSGKTGNTDNKGKN